MQFLTCGLNHQTATVAFREKLSFLPHNLHEPLNALVKQTTIEQVAVLSTCNRTELYCYGTKANSDDLIHWLADHKALAVDELHPHLYTYHGRDALQHLLRVAVGLDSLVLGEPQILGQLKSAYRAAAAAGTLKAELDHLFQFIFQISKRVRHETSLGQFSVSVAAIAIDLLREALPLNDKKILLIGSGETINLCARYLRQQEIGGLFIANRTQEKATLLAEEYAAISIGMTELPAALAECDAVITATSCPYPIISRSTLAMIKAKPRVMIDLAVPRDIEDAVATLPEITVFTIDDLSEIAKRHHREREIAAMRAEQMIATELDHFVEHQRAIVIDDTIRHYRSSIEAIRDLEVIKATQLLERGADPHMVLKRFAHTLTNKLLHAPTVNMRRAAHESDINTLIKLRDIFAEQEEI